MAYDPAKVKSLFLEASDLTSAQERAAFLDHACAGEPELRARVEALLEAEQREVQPADTEVVVGLTQDASNPAHQTQPDIANPTMDISATVGFVEPSSEVMTQGDEEASAVSEPSITGKVIAGRYALLGLLGEGGMGSVYLAEQS